MQTMQSAEGQKGLYDIVLALYDKNPALASILLIITALTPIMGFWFSYLKKLEETKIEQYKYIREKRKSKKKRKKK